MIAGGGVNAVPWNLVCWTIPGVIIGGQIRPRLQGKISQHTMEKAIAILPIALRSARTAMAFAASSHNEQHIALHGNIDYLRPAKLGDTLTAEAHEGSRTNRTGMYNVTVENHTGETLCYFRGRTYGVGGTVIRNGEKS